jgi:hypothetical protein
MKIQLVKETKYDRASYYIAINGEFRAGSICDSLAEALEMFESIKFEISGKRTEVLMQEEI